MNRTGSSPENRSRPNKSRTLLVIMFTVGLLPVLVAYVVYVYFPDLLPTHTTNHGQLISPPVANSLIGLDLDASKWSLILPVGSACGADCKRRFYQARQVHLALGKETQRVKRVLVAVPRTPGSVIDELMEEYQGMTLAKVQEHKLINGFKDLMTDAVSGNYVFLMDPNGNIMMFYTLEKTGNPMLQDIKHLLKISNIG